MGGSRGEVPLIGRERELAALRAAVTRAGDGVPGAVVVAGEAGGGKTRLVRALLEELPVPDALVLRAQCVDVGELGLPYLAVADLVRAARAVGDPEVTSVLDRYPLASALTEPSVPGERRLDEARHLQLFDSTAALLAEIGRVRGPVVLVIEDVQWIDESSADFLRFLLSRVVFERLVLVATARTDGLKQRPSARSLLSELGRLSWVQRLDLEPFDADEVAAYLTLTGHGEEPEIAAEVWRRTRGNPYFVHTLASATEPIRPGEQALPRALADLLVGRLDGLPTDAQRVVRAAAVVARPVSDPLLRAVTGLDVVAMDEAARAAVADGILQAQGADYVFAHDLVRTAVYDDLLPGERARLHGVLAAALETGAHCCVAPAELAHHYAEAQDPAKTLVWSLAAAEEATCGRAPSDALRHLERALTAWPSVDNPVATAGVTQGQVTLQAARSASLAGDPTAVDWAHRAIQVCDAEDDATGAVEARVELVRRLIERDSGDRCVAPAEDAVRRAEGAGVDGATVALAHAVLARALLAARRIDQARPQAERSLDEARAAGVPSLEVDVLLTAAFLDEIAGDQPSAAARLGAALRLARAEDDLAAELRAHFALASLHYYNGDVSGALPVLATAMRRVSESGLRWSAPGVELRVLHAIVLYVAGDFAGSLQAGDAPEFPPPDRPAARLAAVACYSAVAAGHPSAERRLAALSDRWDADPQVALVAGGCAADRLAWEGDVEAAVAMAERAQTEMDRAAGEGMYGGLWLSAIALAALADRAEGCRQRRDDAGLAAAREQGEVLRQRVDRIVEGGRGRPGDLGPEGRAWHLRALAEHARLNGKPAVEEWQQALDAFGYGYAYEEARCHWRLAEALVAAGDRKAARAHAQEAAAAAARMGAGPLQKAVEATIDGARLGASAGSADGVLTEREREVLGLVAEGLTNREIGKRLFISDKTASVHLSNVMTKLNAASRTEAVTVAYRRGLLG